MSNYVINEVFNSIQGEGLFTGRYSKFIRFQGCNLNCAYCDTKQSIKSSGTNVSFDELVNLAGFGNHLVLTGGEPLLQLDNKLIVELKIHNKSITIQTNGTIKSDVIKYLDKDDLICCDIKEVSVDDIMSVLLNVADTQANKTFKFLVDSIEHTIYIDRVVSELKPLQLYPVYISPIIYSNDKEEISKLYKTYTNLNLKKCILNMQVHKLIGVK